MESHAATKAPGAKTWALAWALGALCAGGSTSAATRRFWKAAFLGVTTKTMPLGWRKHIWLVVYLPLWKILVSWDDCSQCMEKNMFQTTKQIWIVDDYWIFMGIVLPSIDYGTMMIYDDIRWYKMIYDEIRWYTMIYDDIWFFLLVSWDLLISLDLLIFIPAGHIFHLLESAMVKFHGLIIRYGHL